MLAGSLSTVTSHTTGTPSSSHTMSAKQVFPCNTCDLVFDISQAQRSHMREPWHVYNLKRRMAELSPISAKTYAEEVETNLVSTKKGLKDTTSASEVVESLSGDEIADESNELDHPIDVQPQIHSCLFCTKDSGGLEGNLEHMSLQHGLFLPKIEHLSSLETLIEYLRTTITDYNECLYCGVIKQSSAGIRRHMLDKGHCMINLDREPELLEFWEFSDSDEHSSDDEEVPMTRAEVVDSGEYKDPPQDEYTLPSGRIITSKSKAREARLLARRLASKTTKESSSVAITKKPVGYSEVNSPAETTRSLVESQGGSQNRAVATRDAVGLIGVSDQQIRSLVALQRKTQRQQAVVHASAAWAGDKGGIHQRHYKVKMNLRDG